MAMAYVLSCVSCVTLVLRFVVSTVVDMFNLILLVESWIRVMYWVLIVI